MFPICPLPLSPPQAMREYERALIRVRLPGGIILQAAFHPQVLLVLSLSLFLSVRRVNPEVVVCTSPRRYHPADSLPPSGIINS